MLRRQGIAGDSFCDLFSGTTVVAQMARQDGFQVIANDMQAYSVVMQRAFLETDGYPQFAALRRALPAIDRQDEGLPRLMFGLGEAPGPESVQLRKVLAYMERIAPQAGLFYETYCEGGEAGRNYFSRDNGRRCEAIRAAVESWRAEGWLSDAEYALVVACVIETMDHLANTASVYGAYLKHVKKTAQQQMVLRLPRLIPGGGPHRASQADANELVQRLSGEGPQGVLYMDPPYNHRQYHANYHLLETIARWDMGQFEPQGKTGLRPATHQRSRYCSRRHVKAAFAELLEQANFRHILVSYNNEGLLGEADLRELLLAKSNGGRHDFHKIPYRRFRADVDSAGRRYKADETHEFLFYIEVRP